MALFNNPFQITDAPDHMTEERDKRIFHDVQTFTLAFVLFAIGIYMTPTVVLFAKTHMQFGPKSIHVLQKAFQQLFSEDPLAPHRYLLNNRDAVPGYFAIVPGEDYPQGKAIIAYLSIGTAFMIPGLLRRLLNPYKRMVMKADASWCDETALRQMEDRRQVGIRGGKMLNLGVWPKGLRAGLPVQLIESLSVLCLAPPGTGKSLHPDEPVLMYDGTTRRTGDLKVGDLLMGPDSTPRKVLVTTPGWGPMYRVNPNKGRSWRCNADHILSLRCSRNPRRRAHNPKRGTVKFMTVNDWITLSDTQKSQYKAWRAQVNFPSRTTPKVDPYLMGLLLGDGTVQTQIAVRNEEPEIAEAMAKYAEHYGLEHRINIDEASGCPSHALIAERAKAYHGTGNPILREIRAYGMDQPCERRFIHLDYKAGSRQTRLEILAGLIDTDGSYYANGNGYDFISKSETLTNDVAFIARSLGLAAYPEPTEKSSQNGFTGTYHRLHISGDVSEIPVRVARKIARNRMINKNVTNVDFTVESIGEGPYFGIVLDGDHQYLLDDFTVTHNTAGCVIPSILSSDNLSLILNDPKPEIWNMVGHWREQVSHNFVLDWSKVDTSRVVLGEDGQPVKTKGGGYLMDHTFHPRFNFLSSKLVPPAGANRDTYFDSIAKVMIADKTSGDTYFSDKGRALLTGFLHYLAAKVNDRPDGDKKRYEGLPEHWHGKEASIPMLVDLLAVSQFNIGKPQAPEDASSNPMAGFDEQQAVDQQQQQGQTDALGQWMERLATEMNPNGLSGADAIGTSARAFTEFTPLIRMADKERSGVIGTMDQALLAFKNEAVRQRTEACDFTPDDLRGIFDEKTQTWKPVSLFVCVNQAEAEAFSTVTALLYEVLSRYLLSYGPNEVNEKTGRKLGPYNVCFCLDEFAKLAKVPAVIEGPDLGRSKGVMYLLAAQDIAQIKQKYSEENVQTLQTTTAVKYVLPQNNKQTVDLIIGMVGKTTIRRGTHSYQEGVHKDASPFKWNRNDTAEETDFLRPVDISGMKPGEHLVLVQNFLNRPMKLKTDMFYNNPEMRKKVHSRGQGPKPTKLIPDMTYEQRLNDHKRRLETEAIRQNFAYKAIEDTILRSDQFEELPT